MQIDTKRKIGKLLVIVGTLFILIAICTTAYQLYVDYKSEKQIKEVTESILKTLPESVDSEFDGLNNRLPLRQISGIDYVFLLEVESCGTKLPIAYKWDKKSIKISPCVYYADLDENLISIGGSIKDYQFGFIENLNAGDVITLSTMTGNRYCFSVDEKETVKKVDKDYFKKQGEGLYVFSQDSWGINYIVINCNPQ